MTENSVKQVVNHFVARINASYRAPVQICDTPASVLDGTPDAYGFSDWRIKPFSDTSWIEPLEKHLGVALPYSYRSLVSRFIFPAFEALGLFFFANTPEGSDSYEFRIEPFGDANIYKALSENGFLQFARPAGGDYDPICFDFSRGSSQDRPIVRIDHEYILCDSIVRISDDIATSFVSLISRIDIETDSSLG